MQVKFVMSINEHVMMSSDQRDANPSDHRSCLPKDFHTYKCTKTRLTSENYITNYKIFQKNQLDSRRFPVFPRAISNRGDFQDFQKL